MVRLFFYDKDGPTLKDVKCLIVNCCGIPRIELEKKQITCTIDDIVVTAVIATVIEWTSRAVDRIKADDIDITRSILSTGGVIDADGAVSVNSNNMLNLRIQSVQFEDKYVGYKLFSTKTGEEIFSFEFDIDVTCSELNHSDISADCLQVWGKTCEDMKIQAAVHGVSTTGSSYAYPICTWHIGDTIVHYGSMIMAIIIKLKLKFVEIVKKELVISVLKKLIKISK